MRGRGGRQCCGRMVSKGALKDKDVSIHLVSEQCQVSEVGASRCDRYR